MGDVDVEILEAAVAQPLHGDGCPDLGEGGRHIIGRHTLEMLADEAAGHDDDDNQSKGK